MGLRSSLPGIPFYRLASFTILCFAFTSSFAQNHCATFINHPKNRNGNSAVFEKWLSDKLIKRKLQQAQGRVQGGPYQIPVVFHIIHNGEDIGTGSNIPDAQILSQIDVLNRDYKRLNTDAADTPAEFAAVAGNLDVEFVLAKQDPDGFATNGIVRVKGQESFWPIEDYDLLKTQSYWPSEDYFNVWVSNIWGADKTGFIGFSQFPVSPLPGLEGSPDNASTDGVIVDYQTFGSVDDGAFKVDSRYNKGRTLTHETGHFFGLRHIWGDVGGCQGTDYVDDTPNQDGSTSGCPTGPKAGCVTNEHRMYQNYLDYTNDACMNLFTQDQVDRMTIVIENSPRRVSLLTSHGLQDPPPVNDDLGLSAVISPKVISCDQITPSIELKNYGINQVTSGKIQMAINGNVIETKDISVTLDPLQTTTLDFTPQSLITGTTQFSFEVLQTNGGTDGNDLNNIKTVNTYSFDQSMNSAAKIPMREKFESDFTSQWVLINPTNGENWKTVTTNFNSSLFFEAFNDTNLGDEAWLISPLLDLSQTTKASMFFDLSYALNKGRQSNERLRIMAALNCNDGFNTTLFTNAGGALSDITSTTSWMPSEAADWTRKFVDLTSLTGNSDVRLAFVVTNGHGNNLYVDNIEFYNANDPVQPEVSDPFYIYYNPNGDADFYVKFNLPEQENVSVDMFDTLGKNVYHKSFYNLLNETLPVDVYNVAGSIYIIRLKTSKHVFAARVFVKAK